MRRAIDVLLTCLAVGLISSFVMAQTARKAAARRAPSPAAAPVAEDPSLPRVLLLGDSISQGYTRLTRAALAGKANLLRAPDNCGPTSKGLEKLDQWLGDGHWDVIHFNFGLHDLKIIDGKPQVPLDQYEKNLRKIVARLKTTGAVLVWCSTTPVPEGLEASRKPADVPAYNAVAQTIMREQGIAIDDLYAYVLPKLKDTQLPNNVHFTGAGYEFLAKQVAESILAALKTHAKK